jgi:DNA polymerase I-like protein with 3'-5' exonuclease and polymerase domains
MTLLKDCTPTSLADAPYHLVLACDLPQIVERFIAEGAPLGLDVEATSTDPWRNFLISLQLGDERGVFICDVRRLTPDEECALAEAISLLFSGRVELMAHNGKFDLLTLAVRALLTPDDVKRLRLYDSMLVEQALLGGALTDTGKREKAGLDATGARYGLSIPKEARSYFGGLDQRPEWHEPLPPSQLAYAARDVAVLPIIRREQEALADAHGLVDTLAREMDCAPAIIAMELTGVAVYVPGWRRALDGMRAEAEELEAHIQAELFPAYRAAHARTQVEQTQALIAWQAGHDAAIDEARAAHGALPEGKRPKWGDVRKHTISAYRAEHPRPPTPAPLPDTLSLHSPTQLLEAFALQGVHLLSTEADTLEDEAKAHPGVGSLTDLHEWRKASKLLDAYGESLLSHIQSDGRLHPSWRQIGGEDRGIATGRMSCSEPNLQQIPSKGSGAQLRRYIIASPGHTLVSCDLSQIEPRILAERSGDPTLLALFAQGGDIYTATAIQLGILPQGATKDDAKAARFAGVSVRDAAKTLTLATIYGQWARGLAEALGCDKDTAQEHLDAFFALFPLVARYKDRIEAEAVATGVARSIGGRWRVWRRYPEPERHQFVTWEGFMAARSQWWKDEHRMRRQAVNHTIQATGADILKLAMTLAFRSLPPGSHLVAAVHDELLVEAPAACADRAASVLTTAMEDAARAFLPTVALGSFEVSIAPYWRKS